LFLAKFVFKTANPVLGGENAALFTVTDETEGAQIYYTVDGSVPAKDSPTSTPVLSGTALSLDASKEFVLRIRAFRHNYEDSDIVEKEFSPASYVPNSMNSVL